MKRFYCTICKRVKRVRRIPRATQSPSNDNPVNRIGECDRHSSVATSVITPRFNPPTLETVSVMKQNRKNRRG